MLTSKLLILIGVSLQSWDVMAVIFKQHPLDKPPYCAHEVGCFSPVTKKVLPVGVDVYPNSVCKKLTCQSDGYTLVHSCEKTVVPRGCHLSRDSKLQYPHCCAKVVCLTTVVDRPHKAVVVYNDGRGDDYKLNEEKKILYDNKNETSRRAPWNKNGDVSSHRVTPEYSTHDREGGRVDYYKPDNRGDDYKSKEDKKILYDKKKESSRRAPWNKNEHIDGYYSEERYPVVDQSRYNDVTDYGRVYPHRHSRYGVVDHRHKAGVVYNDGRGDDYKLNEDKKIIYDNKGETSRRAPWNKNGDVNSHRVTPEYSTHDAEGGRVDYYKPDNRGDDYKSKEDKKTLYDKKKESSRRAPWNKNEHIDGYYSEERYPVVDQSRYNDVTYYGRVYPHRHPRYGVVDHHHKAGVVYNDGRGDDYKLNEDKKIIYDNKDETSRRAPWNENGDVSSHRVTPAYSTYDKGGRVDYYQPDNRGDDYKSKEDKKTLYDKKKESSRRAPWNKNENINYGARYDAPEYYEDYYEDGTVAYYEPDYRGDDYQLEEDKEEYYNDEDEYSRRSPWDESEAQGEYIDDPEYYYDDVGFDDGRGDNYKSHEKQGIQSYDKKKVTSRRAPWNDNPTV